MKYWKRILLVGLISVPVQANEPALVDSRGYVEFSSIDSDHNGYVSRVEARSIYGVESAFDSADTNRDGLLNSLEYKRARRTAELN